MHKQNQTPPQGGVSFYNKKAVKWLENGGKSLDRKSFCPYNIKVRH